MEFGARVARQLVEGGAGHQGRCVAVAGAVGAAQKAFGPDAGREVRHAFGRNPVDIEARGLLHDQQILE